MIYDHRLSLFQSFSMFTFLSRAPKKLSHWVVLDGERTFTYISKQVSCWIFLYGFYLLTLFSFRSECLIEKTSSKVIDSISPSIEFSRHLTEKIVSCMKFMTNSNRFCKLTAKLMEPKKPKAMLTKLWSWMTRKVLRSFGFFLRLYRIESFINKLLEQPFCHYQTENNIRSPTFLYISFFHHHIPKTDIHKISFSFSHTLCWYLLVNRGRCGWKWKIKKNKTQKKLLNSLKQKKKLAIMLHHYFNIPFNFHRNFCFISWA